MTQAQIDRQRRPFEGKYSGQFQKALIQSIQPLMEILSKTDTPQVLFDHLNTISRDYIRDTFVQLYKEVGRHFHDWTYLKLKGYQPDYLIKNEYDWITDEEIRRYIQASAAVRIVTITETSRKQAELLIRQILEEAIAEELSIFQTTELLEQEFPKRWKIASKFRAERIARTEIVGASNRGSYLGAKQTGLNLKKKWLVARDGREREWHGEMAFKDAVFIDGYFIVGGERMEYPGDASASGRNVINCRCAIGYERA